MLDAVIKKIEKGKPFFDKIAQNIYLGAVRDGFLTAMPAILFSSVFILAASIPEIFGIKLPADVSTWLWKVYNYSMGIVGLLVSATTAKCLAESIWNASADSNIWVVVHTDYCQSDTCQSFNLSSNRYTSEGCFGDRSAEQLSGE